MLLVNNNQSGSSSIDAGSQESEGKPMYNELFGDLREEFEKEDKEKENEKKSVEEEKTKKKIDFSQEALSPI